MKILLLTPPLTEMNTPYPATAYLKGFLSTQGYDVSQADLGLELFLRLFSRAGLAAIGAELEPAYEARATGKTDGQMLVAKFFMARLPRYLDTIGPVMRFLQGQDPTLALRICSRTFLPEGLRFMALGPLAQTFGSLGTQDRAKYLATCYLKEIADLISMWIDPKFTLKAYGQAVTEGAPSFDNLEAQLAVSNTLLERYIEELTVDHIRRIQPALVGITVPFAGNVYGAFRIAKTIRAMSPAVRIVLGGGYVNTELRSLNDPRVFDYVDFVTFDNGERPLQCLLEHIADTRASDRLVRTMIRDRGRVVFRNDPSERDVPHREVGTPSYAGLPLRQYVSTINIPNPMQRLWADGRWNKLTLANGCYWRQCTFCDVSLDYIGRYDPVSADILVDRIEALIAETGESGFHFVDEAAPPSVLRALAERLIARGLAITWWGNIRFDKTFTPELTGLLARGGCVAVTGGLEVASDRLLALIKKGVTIEQVARVTRAFAKAGILVHTYLMYGFPTQTEQETIDSLEIVRQLFKAGCVQSGAWHRFSPTAHSPIGLSPSEYGIELRTRPDAEYAFTRYALDFADPVGCDHKRLGAGLEAALHAYMLGVGLDRDVRTWFGPEGDRVPAARVTPDRVEQAIAVGSLSGIVSS